jgi:hypothetical protein
VIEVGHGIDLRRRGAGALEARGRGGQLALDETVERQIAETIAGGGARAAPPR